MLFSAALTLFITASAALASPIPTATQLPFYKLCVNRTQETKVTAQEKETVEMLLGHYRTSSCEKTANALWNETNLDLTGYGITSTEPLSDLPHLVMLNLYKNKLVELKLKNMHQLKVLFASFNQLESIDLENMTSLVEIDAGVNQISKVRFKNLPYLEKLDLPYNALTSLAFLNGAVNLRLLTVSENKLTKLDFVNVDRLEVLHGESNSIEDIESLKSTNFLRGVYLDFNRIKNVCALKIHQDITDMSFRNNNIKSLDCMRNHVRYGEGKLDFALNPIEKNPSACPISGTFQQLTIFCRAYLEL